MTLDQFYEITEEREEGRIGESATCNSGLITAADRRRSHRNHVETVDTIETFKITNHPQIEILLTSELDDW